MRFPAVRDGVVQLAFLQKAKTEIVLRDGVVRVHRKNLAGKLQARRPNRPCQEEPG